MSETFENVCVCEKLRGRRARARLSCCELGDDGKMPVPATVPGSFVVDLLEATGPMDRGEAGLMLSWLEWVEVEARGCPELLEGIGRLRGAVMKAATAGPVLAPVETYKTGGGL